MMQEQELKGKVALVTGAGRGIGKAIAAALAARGAMVIVNYNKSAKEAEAVVQEIREQGGLAEAIGCDVSDDKMCEEMIRKILEEWKHLDILVNNAGIVKDNLIMRMSEEDFCRVVDTNLKGTFHTIRCAARYLLKQKSGRIINISSVSGVLGNAGQANYAASKAGIIGLTKSVARELASRGITVNAIAPGYVETDMTDALPDSVKEKVCAQIPMKRMGQAQEIAEAAVFLASDRASYITGQVLCIDGGMAM